MARKTDYFGLSWMVSLVLAIIPVTAWICGALTRLKEGNIIAFIIRLIGGFNVIWVLDLICMVMNHKIFRLF